MKRSIEPEFESQHHPFAPPSPPVGDIVLAIRTGHLGSNRTEGQLLPSSSLPFAKEAPAGLALPADIQVRVSAMDREHAIFHHGFSEDQIRPEWWQDLGITIRFGGSEPAALTRQHLFELGSVMSSDEELLDFVWHVLAWGSGTSRRNNRQRVENCRLHVPVLRAALEHARAGEVRAAYNALILPGKAVVPRLGPAFFTKLLYFASEGVEHRCLILDARVARSMYRAGWNMAPTYPNRTFSYNWFTDTYVAYCELLSQWARQASASEGRSEVRADMIERVLFGTGGPERQLTT